MSFSNIWFCSECMARKVFAVPPPSVSSVRACAGGGTDNRGYSDGLRSMQCDSRRLDPRLLWRRVADQSDTHFSPQAHSSPGPVGPSHVNG